MPGWLEGKVSLITGGASGIGKATAMIFAREGASIVVADVSEEEGEKVASDIKETGGNAIFVKTDVSKSSDVEALIEKTVQTYGRLDCACNNAGIEGAMAPTAECTEDNWSRVIDINLKGVWLCMKYEIPMMLRQGSGAIVNMSSIAGLVGFTELPAYCASKGGINQLTKAAALEYAKQGVRVNAICPGCICTPMVDRIEVVEKDFIESVVSLHPIGRIGTPEEVAEAAVWLCSPASSFVTGHIMAVDGGYVAQ